MSSSTEICETDTLDIDIIKKGRIILDFYSETCIPCKNLNSILNEISNELNVKVIKCDVTKNYNLTQMFGIMSIPTLIFLKDNKIKNAINGLYPKEKIISLIKEFLCS